MIGALKDLDLENNGFYIATFSPVIKLYKYTAYTAYTATSLKGFFHWFIALQICKSTHIFSICIWSSWPSLLIHPGGSIENSLAEKPELGHILIFGQVMTNNWTRNTNIGSGHDKQKIPEFTYKDIFLNHENASSCTQVMCIHIKHYECFMAKKWGEKGI